MSDNIGNVWTVRLDDAEDAALKKMLEAKSLPVDNEGLKAFIFNADVSQPGPLSGLVGYFRENPGQPYCLAIVSPKVAKLRKQFQAKLRT